MATNRMTYEVWIDEVNEILTDKLDGFTLDDLVDAPTRDWYDDGMSPREAARAAIRNNNYEVN